MTVGFTREPLEPHFDLAVETKPGDSPRMPSVVSRTYEPKPIGHNHAHV